MPGSKDRTPTSRKSPSNAFRRRFLRRLDERDEPITSAEADLAGPWSVVPLPGRGFGLFRAGESPARGHQPAAVFADRFLALLAAAVLPGTGRDLLLHLHPEPGPDGYEVRLDDGTVVGHLPQFEELLADSLNVAVSLVRQPASLAFLLQAAGSSPWSAAAPSWTSGSRRRGNRGRPVAAIDQGGPCAPVGGFGRAHGLARPERLAAADRRFGAEGMRACSRAGGPSESSRGGLRASRVSRELLG